MRRLRRRRWQSKCRSGTVWPATWRGAASTFTTGTGAEYLATGEAYLSDLLEHMEQAKRFIFLEYYIVARGEIFDRMLDIFRRKRAEGVEIKFLFDDFGSMMRFGNEEIDALQSIGVEVMIFNPVHQYVNRLYFNYRDHRKIACIDGEVAYTGGANLADEYANITERFGYWKDCGVRLTGRGAWGLTRDFIHLWERMGGHAGQRLRLLPSPLRRGGSGLRPALCGRPGQQPHQHRRGRILAADRRGAGDADHHHAVSGH